MSHTWLFQGKFDNRVNLRATVVFTPDSDMPGMEGIVAAMPINGKYTIYLPDLGTQVEARRSDFMLQADMYDGSYIEDNWADLYDSDLSRDWE